MKTIFSFLFNQKKEYIGLSSFKTPENKKPEIKKITPTLEKTSLTGMIRRVS